MRSVALAHAPIEFDLSARTGAAALLGDARPAAVREPRQAPEPGRYHLAVG